MKRVLIGLFLCTFVMAISACGDDDNGGGSTDSLSTSDPSGDPPASQDPFAANVARAETAIHDLEAQVHAMIDAFCTCRANGDAAEKEGCVRDMKPNTSLPFTACEETAVNCGPNSYVAFQICHRDRWQEYAECVSACPDNAGFQACTDAFDATEAACQLTVTSELANAFQACADGQTPTCGGSGDPGGSGGGSGSGGGLIGL